jgi:uncharacterized protein
MEGDSIFDAHMHIDDVPALGWRLTGRQCVEAMDRAGIQKAIVMTIVDLPEVNPDALDQIADACSEFPGRLFAFARIHPFYGIEAIGILEKALTQYSCFKGLKLHPVTTISHPGSKETIQLIRRAAEHNAPTLFHCGDEPLTTPLEIALAADACPEATIILGHMGGYYHVDEAIVVAERYSNVVLETSAMPYPAKIREAVQRIGSDRVIYASDGPVASPIIEVEKVRLARLDSKSERNVFALNTQRIIEAVA